MDFDQSINTLRQAAVCYWDQNITEYTQLMQTVKNELDTWPALEPETGEINIQKKRLFGEWLLVSSLYLQKTPEKLPEIYRRAWSFLQYRSRVLRPEDPSIWNTYSPALFFLTCSGTADETSVLVEEGVWLYQRLVGGGFGAAELYRAQISSLRGETELAGHLAEQAFILAEQNGQKLSALYAAELIGHLAVHNKNGGLINQTASYIRQSRKSEVRSVRELADCICAMDSISAGKLSRVPDWIRNTSFTVAKNKNGFQLQSDNILPSTIPCAALTHIRYQISVGQPRAALKVIDRIQYVFPEKKFPLYNIYLNLYSAICFLRLNDREEAIYWAEQAMNLLRNDRFTRIPGEFPPELSRLMFQIEHT